MRFRYVAWPLVLACAPVWARTRPRHVNAWEDELLEEEEEAPLHRRRTASEWAGEAQDPPPPYRDELHGHWRLAAGAGLRFGTFLVNNLDTGTNMQAHVDLGLRRRRWWIAGEYALTSTTLPGGDLAGRGIVTTSGSADGLVHRLGGFVRYSVSRLGCRDAGFDVYVEGGAGVQHLRWDDGGTWTRPDLSLGFGVAGWFVGEVEHLGISVGLRVTLAPRNDVEHAPATCAGPCDQATPPTGVDRSFMFDVTIPFGR